MSNEPIRATRHQLPRTSSLLRRSAAVARRNEGEREQKLNAEVVGEKASDDLYDDHDRGGQEHAARQIQDRL